MSINKYKKLFEDETGYKKIPLDVRLELSRFLYDVETEDNDDFYNTILNINDTIHEYDAEDYPKLVNFDLAGTKIFKLAQEIMNVERQKEEIWNYVNMRDLEAIVGFKIKFDDLKKALQNFQHAYGENVDPLEHMSMEDFLNAFGKKD